MIFAYTIKGYGLGIAGRPHNHSVLLDAAQIDRLRAESGLEPNNEWDRFRSDSPEGRLCEAAAQRLERGASPPAPRFEIPGQTFRARPGHRLDPGRVRTGVARPLPGRRCLARGSSPLPRTSPSPRTSAASSTRSGVWGTDEEPVYDAMEDSPLKWRVWPTGPAHRDGHR